MLQRNTITWRYLWLALVPLVITLACISDTPATPTPTSEAAPSAAPVRKQASAPCGVNRGLVVKVTTWPTKVYVRAEGKGRSGNTIYSTVQPKTVYGPLQNAATITFNFPARSDVNWRYGLIRVDHWPQYVNASVYCASGTSA
jgi:hypothetical protein